MSPTEAVIDGTLELDVKPNLHPGRVTVILRQQAETFRLPDDPFWQRLRAIWAMPRSEGHSPDGGDNTLAEVEKLRNEWDEHQQTLEQVQIASRKI